MLAVLRSTSCHKRFDVEGNQITNKCSRVHWERVIHTIPVSIKIYKIARKSVHGSDEKRRTPYNDHTLPKLMNDCKIDTVECHVLKIDDGEKKTNPENQPEYESLPGTDYYLQEAGYVYSTNSEHLLVKVETDSDEYGWGEVQAPVVPEVSAELITSLAGPLVLGKDPRNVEVLWDRMYDSMNIRGHFLGFMIDAMAAIDIALWDLRGKLLGQSVSALLGGKQRDRLPAYVTGGSISHLDEGFDGIKIGVHGPEDVPIEIDRDRIEDPSQIKVDNHWRFDSAHEAIVVDKHVEEFGAAFVEAPLIPEDISGAARISKSLDIPLALGESLRTVHDFRERIEQDAVDIGQPDINRTGITEGKRIVDLLDANGRPVAPHMSASLGPGIAATWHISSAAPNFEIQEHAVNLGPKANRFLDPGITIDEGTLVVPTEPGLGIDIDETAVESYRTEFSQVTTE